MESSQNATIIEQFDDDDEVTSPSYTYDDICFNDLYPERPLDYDGMLEVIEADYDWSLDPWIRGQYPPRTHIHVPPKRKKFFYTTPVVYNNTFK